MDNISRWIKTELESCRKTGSDRPAVTLSYAQTLDGSISAGKNKRTKLSCDESMLLTHTIRSIHDAILVGIGTVITDDPKLTVKLVKGKNPIPVILDSDLRIPEDARLLSEPPYPVVFHSPEAPPEKQTIITNKGGLLFECDMVEPGILDLRSVLQKLPEYNIHSVMVEGGAEILTGFLEKRLWDFAIITISPQWLGGYRCVSHTLGEHAEMNIEIFEKIGSDMVIAGKRKI
jgi:riboflavin-specific deaminase-like protein